MKLMPYYVVMIAVAPIRAEPDHRSEQITQARLGEIVKFLEEEDRWLKVELESDGYVGYISRGMVAGFSKEDATEWRESEKFLFGERSSNILEAPYKSAGIVRTAYMGVKLPIVSRKGVWVELRLPDGIKGWTRGQQFHLQNSGTRTGIADTARLFLGAPYLWGGRSTGGFDCSGFVQTVFELNGIKLPRDTSRQIKAGEEIGTDINMAKEGDLLFFSDKKGKLNHIGIYLGNRKFIHSSGIVKITALNSEEAVDQDIYINRFMQARSVEEYLN